MLAIEFFETLNFQATGSREEDIRLVNLAQSGDIEARNKLVLANMGMVILIAKKKHCSHSRVEPCDLISEGVLGLIRSIEKYDQDKSKGGRFITYAKYWIIMFINEAVHNAHLLTVPLSTLSAYRYGRQNTSKWTAVALESWRDASNLDDDYWENCYDRGTEKDVQQWITKKYHDEIFECIGELPKMQQDVLFLILCGYNQREIASAMAITRSAFSAIYVRAIESLRGMYSTVSV